jgi:hypothetical protein
MTTETATIPLNYERHPVLALPQPDWVRDHPDDFLAYIQSRTLAIHNERRDPLLHGWESPIWKAVDALFGFECFDGAFKTEITRRFGPDWTWERWAEALRKAHGFPAPVKLILINGGNRGGKSQYGGKRSVQRIHRAPKQNAWCLQSNHNMSVTYQQALINQHMPADKQNAQIITGKPEYIAYKSATGYSNGKFVLYNGSVCEFKYYTMDKSDATEGGELDWIWDDELVPADWVLTQLYRIVTRDGRILVTFTPVEGYTETVRMLTEGSTPVRETIAYLCPDDEGPALEWAALGFPTEQAWLTAYRGGHKDLGYGPNSIPEDVHAWIQGTPSQPLPPPGRKFKKVPRILRGIGTERGGRIEYQHAVVYFHSADNPYGNPSGVIAKSAGKTQDEIRERFYGIATKTMSCRFPMFDERIHVLPDDKIPLAGTNYLICDPSGGRNFGFLWVRVNHDTVYFYREWPGPYPIPGIGLPGPWAEIDGKRKDGRKGPAQNPFGFSLLRYKQELARLEGWDIPATHLDKPREWTPGPKTKERIHARYIDARPANSSTATAEGSVTLLEELEDIGLDFIPVHLGPAGSLAPGDTQSAVHLITDALSYNNEQPLSYTNRPKLYISDRCTNMIFALKIWTGEDGQRGACKDFIDLARYAFASDLQDVGSGNYYTTVGGGSY